MGLAPDDNLPPQKGQTAVRSDFTFQPIPNRSLPEAPVPNVQLPAPYILSPAYTLPEGLVAKCPQGNYNRWSRASYAEGMLSSEAVFGPVGNQPWLRGVGMVSKGEAPVFFSQFENNTAMMLLIRSADGQIVDANPAAVEFYGYSRAQLQGMRIDQINVLPHESVLEEMGAAARLAKNYFVFRHRLSTGVVRSVEVYSSPVDIEGEHLLFSIIHDITDRLHDEAVLKESERKFFEIFQSNPDAMVITRLSDGVCLEINEAYTRLYGFLAGEVVGRSLGRDGVGIWVENDQRAQFVRELRSTMRVSGWEETHRRKNGTTFIASQSASIVDVGGVACVLSIVRDVSARVEAEIAVRRSEELLSTLMDSLPDIVFVKDRASRYQRVNTAFARLNGVLDPREIIGQPTESNNPRSLANAYRSDDLFVMDTGQSIINKEEEIEDAKGVRGTYLTTKVPLRGPAGNIVGMVGISRDITERQEFQAHLQQAQKLESLGVLAGGIAHDFNNLLTAIMGNANLAQVELPKDSDAQARLDEIVKEAQRAADLCRQLLAYAGKGRFQIVPLDISEVIQDMKGMLTISIAKKVFLQLKLADDPPILMGDASQIRQVIMNLVINASEAIGDESGIITIVTGAMYCERNYLDDTWSGDLMHEGECVYVEVIDTGKGMDEATKSKIFEPFFTTKFTGRGLGLSAVLGIVRGHKGAIKVYSELGKGTAFKLLFPAARGKVPLAGVDTGACAEWKGHGTILLVDDENVVRNVCKAMLEQMGFHVLVAGDGKSALETFNACAGDIACVVLDLTMPTMDGVEAFGEMRKIDPHVKVLLTSGYNEQAVVQEFVGKGLAGFIQKPYQLSTLEQKLRQILEE